MTSARKEGTPLEVILLGVAGGPVHWRGGAAGISTAVCVQDGWYAVDCGAGFLGQAQRAGLDVADLKGVFITHLHSDHTVDLPALLLFGWWNRDPHQPPVPVFGPGLSPNDGIEALWGGLCEAYREDIDDRVADSLLAEPERLWTPQRVVLPPEIEHRLADDSYVEMEPCVVHREGDVTVTTTLADHAPMSPALAFRFDVAGRSVTISGDTRPCDNVVRLARNTDLLLHEVIDGEWVADKERRATTPQELASVRHHRRSHTAAAEVGGVAQRASARHLVAHHLVPGDDEPGRWDDVGRGFDGPSQVGYDLMRFVL